MRALRSRPPVADQAVHREGAHRGRRERLLPEGADAEHADPRARGVGPPAPVAPEGARADPHADRQARGERPRRGGPRRAGSGDLRAQAAAEGVLGREDVIEALCRAALDSDVVQRAARRKHWREVYVGVPYSDGVLEGYIDLLYEDDDGLVIVDYKTDSWRSESELDAKADRYRIQLQAYASAVRDAVGRDVARALLLFLARNEVNEVVVVRTVEL